MGEKPEIGHGVDTVVAYINQTSTGRCSVLKMAMSYSLGLIAASMLLLGGVTACAFAQGTKDPSNPIVSYPTNTQRRLDNPPTRPRNIYRYDSSPYTSPYGGDGVVPLRRLHRRYR